MRAGGSQIGCPNGGYVNGGYAARWNLIKAYYARARGTGAHFSLLVSGMWGSDGVCNVPRLPGDGGNWTEYTAFVNQLIADAKANGMTGSDVRWDLWNEPNIFFWGRTQSQYLEMIKRGTRMVRAAIPGAVIEGPSYAGVPTGGNSWWNTYLDYVKANNVVPGIMSWHDLPGDPATDSADGAIDVRYANIPSWLNTSGSVNVLVERMPSTNAYVSAPAVVSNGRRTVSGNAVTVSLNWTSAKDAYAITLTP